jgi:diguanylate cyclase (GGDEF)-like protein
MTDPPIRVLILDDNAADVELMIQALSAADLLVDVSVAADEADLRALGHDARPDVILCDQRMPAMDGVAAQRLLNDRYGAIPLIFVTGTLSEALAVKALQRGAVDYVLKSNLIRLPTAVKRAAGNARELKRLETSLNRSDERVIYHAARLEQLWRVSGEATQGREAILSAMLDEAAGALRPAQRFHGYLGRIEGSEVVIVARETSGFESGQVDKLGVGTRTPVDQTAFPRVGRSQSWSDLSEFPEMKARVDSLGWRSAITTQFRAADSAYSLTFASSEPTTTFGPEDAAYLDILAMSLANHIELNELDRSLRDQEERSREHAKRLEDLWRIVNAPHQSDADLWRSMLRTAAASIWPGIGSRATLWRVAQANLVLEAVAETAGTGLGTFEVALGDMLPYENSIVSKIEAEGGGTQAWDDLQSAPDLQVLAGVAFARALVVTTFIAGGTTWAMSFASGYPTTQPIGAHERAYIEVLSSYFVHHVQARWQFERIQYEQSHDVLTGLLNRSQFRSQARSAARRSVNYGLLFVDINAFRGVNAVHGQMIGDALLVEIGNALLRRANDGDLVGRIGGDIFAVYLEGVRSKAELAARARTFAEAFVQPFSTGDREGKEFISRTASIGAAMAPDDGATIDAIFLNAEAALVAAKERGHGSSVSFEPGMESEARDRAALRNELTTALAEDQFTLYFQPHIDLVTGAVSGCEALIRWNHPTRGLVMPGAFIPFAEQIGMITSIDNWVMRNSFAVAAELGALRPDFRLYFNLSGRQAGDPRIIRAFTDAARRGVPLRNLGVEITESDAMRDVEATRRVCRALHRIDVRIAIDDFGTGYSSLSSLKRFPIDIVKIDRSFVSGVLTDLHDEAIADTIISIAARFGFESLAEGVEQLGEIGWLRQRACRYIQGYAICHPLPLVDFKLWCAAQS